MPKMKSKSGAKKRFVKTATGKIRRRRAGHSHILTKKDQKRKRRLRSTVVMEGSDVPRIKKMLSC